MRVFDVIFGVGGVLLWSTVGAFTGAVGAKVGLCYNSKSRHPSGGFMGLFIFVTASLGMIASCITSIFLYDRIFICGVLNGIIFLSSAVFVILLLNL